MNLLIVIPTYNEIDNISAIISEIEKVSNAFSETMSFSILVVDDGSPDGTANAVKTLQNNYSNLFILERSEKKGLADAYIAGFKWGIEYNYDVFLEMDADFSHKPEYIPELAKIIEAGYDVAIGSRNIKGGAVEGWSAFRNFISKGGSLYSRIILGMGNKKVSKTNLIGKAAKNMTGGGIYLMI